jgi:hypothetical protein
MATNLKLKKKCHIVPPDWLNVGVCNAYLSELKRVSDRVYRRVFAGTTYSRDFPA